MFTLVKSNEIHSQGWRDGILPCDRSFVRNLSSSLCGGSMNTIEKVVLSPHVAVVLSALGMFGSIRRSKILLLSTDETIYLMNSLNRGVVKYP